MLRRALRAATVTSSDSFRPSFRTEIPVVAKNRRGAWYSGGTR
jgi:hypothetical protein